jgi:hypothetical protein
MNEIKQKDAEANRIIDALGGTSKVAELFEMTTGGVSQWRTNGIPKTTLKLIQLQWPNLFEKKAA